MRVRDLKNDYSMKNAKRRNIYTDSKTWEALLRIGNGNASAGVREAVKQANQNVCKGAIDGE